MNNADVITVPTANKPSNMPMIIIVFLLIGMLGFTGIGLYILNNQEEVSNGAAEVATTEDITLPTPTTSLNNTAEEIEVTSTAVAGSYTAYKESLLSNADSGDVVLFFKANWCPTCRALDNTLSAASIPDNLTILTLDYDTETALKQKYGVTYQHTLVQVDSNGDELSQWSHSYTLEDILSQLK